MGNVLSEERVRVIRRGAEEMGEECYFELCDSHEDLRALVKAQRLTFYDVIADSDERLEDLGEELRKMSNARIDAERRLAKAEEALRLLHSEARDPARGFRPSLTCVGVIEAYFASVDRGVGGA